MKKTALFIITSLFCFSCQSNKRETNNSTEITINSFTSVDDTAHSVTAKAITTDTLKEESSPSNQTYQIEEQPIQREILGFIIGETSKQTVLNRLKRAGYNTKKISVIESLDETYQCNPSITFEKIKWDMFFVSFFKGKVYLIDLYMKCDSSQKMDFNFGRISYALKDKYEYWLDNSSNQHKTYFSDKKTYIEISKDIDNLHLRYGDETLTNLFYEE